MHVKWCFGAFESLLLQPRFIIENQRERVMRKFFMLAVIFSVTATLLSAQNQWLTIKPLPEGSKQTNEPVRNVQDQGLTGVTVSWDFYKMFTFEKREQNELFQLLRFENFSFLQETGKPALPVHEDWICIPEGVNPRIEVVGLETMPMQNLNIYPALQPASDKVGAPNPSFEIDKDFYQTTLPYPANFVSIEGLRKMQGVTLAKIRIAPILYVPGSKTATVLKHITYKIVFEGGKQFAKPSSLSPNFASIIQNIVLNTESVSKDFAKATSESKTAPVNRADYIILTHSAFKVAADSLANWKRQLGYKVEVISRSLWTSAMVQNEISQRYAAWNPKPGYFLIIGDHGDIPGNVLQSAVSNGVDYASDLYYACMDGANDFVPDIAHGRISVTSEAQAIQVVRKIINYERNPQMPAAYYKNGVIAAYFEDDDNNGINDRRFDQTAEEAAVYLSNQQAFNINRVYYTEPNRNPTYYNDGYYAMMEPLPSNLLKPTFPWNGTRYDIINALNSANGAHFLLHRDHGYEIGWGDPNFTVSDVNNLTNSQNPTLVLSINCLTGKFYEPECFAEKFLRHPNGGAVGVFAHAEVSYSGYNDGLSLGMIDAIWANPGYIPTFTGSGDNPSGTPTAHASIVTPGDVMNQAIMRMVQTWGESRYTNELIHYFGDPAMKVWTAVPGQITATHANAITCNTPGNMAITASVSTGIVTLFVEGELVSKANLVNGAASLTYPSIAGNNAILTISALNYKPYQAIIPINGGCPKAKFEYATSGVCANDTIYVTDYSSGNNLQYNWNFGQGANILTSVSSGNQQIVYAGSGWKKITLTVTNGSGQQSTFEDSIMVKPFCEFAIDKSATSTITRCTGTLYDNGWESNYSNSANGTITIISPSNNTITLRFDEFEFESNNDVLFIYDGSSFSSPLIGQYTGTTLPNFGIINTTSNAVTIRQLTNGTIDAPGFKLNWQCNSTVKPQADFKSSDTVTCSGQIQFVDQSYNGATSWLWDFGDGTTSLLQHPLHSFPANGNYTIRLIATNLYGTDTIVKTNFIQIAQMPILSSASQSRCNEGQVVLNATGSGIIEWYDSPSTTQSIATGASFTTPGLSQSKTYYVQNRVANNVFYAAKTDNSGGGGYYAYATVHYLKFNCLHPYTLASVKVYAQTAGDREIKLVRWNGQILASKTVNIPVGQSRVQLGFNLPADTGLRLVGPTSPALYRNTSGVTFPYQVAGKISITGSSQANSYYYFYDWEINDGECISNRIPVQAVIKAPKPVITSSMGMYFCNGDSILLKSTPAPSYNWQPGGYITQEVWVKQAANYAVIISDSVCSSTSNTYPTYYFPIVSINPVVNILNDTVWFNANAVNYDTLRWDFGNGMQSTIVNPAIKYDQSGTYIVTLKVYGRCGMAQQQISVPYFLSVGENDQVRFSAYPNPATNQLTLQGNFKDADIRLIDVTGREVYKTVQTADKVTIATHFMSRGTYLLRVVQDGKISNRKILITR